jgi:uncharacterized protein (TIGR03435 family)
MKRSILAVLAGILGIVGVSRPQGAERPKFEVASVKRVMPGGAPPANWQPSRVGGRYTLRSVSLKTCLQIAHRLMPNRISGPAWMESERYEIAATMPADTPHDQVLAMLQALLIERFQLELHWEEKESSVYALVVGKDGARLQKTEDLEATPRVEPLRSGLKVRNRSVEDLANTLTIWTDRPVIDLTGIRGSYDFDLDWSGEADTASDGAGPAISAVRGADSYAVLRALSALGLRAEGQKVRLKFLVIDAAERVPREN